MGRRQPTSRRRRRASPRRSVSRRRRRRRACLRKGCGRRFLPTDARQRYCGDAVCAAEVRRWRARLRQQRHRRDPEARDRHREAERARRQELRANERTAKGAVAERPRGHAYRVRLGAEICARPGCYAHPCASLRAPSRYCGKRCRLAVRRVLDRERKARSRRTYAGRLKRRHEYDRAAKRPRREREVAP